MAQVLLLSTQSYPDDSYHRLARYAGQDRFGAHLLTEDPAAADLILFVEHSGSDPLQEALRRHPYYGRYREKCFCFGESSAIVPFLPGVYHGVERRWHRRDRIRGGFFLSEFDNPYATFSAPPDHAFYLYSFIGSAFTHPVRRKVIELRHPRGLVLDTSQDICIWQTGTSAEKEAYWRRYADASKQSRFVLCPRGQSPSSVRLFDTMEIGRTPVIIGDAWIPPDGPDWDAFSVRVREKDVRHLPALLAEREGEAAGMGLRARQAWEDWFSPEVSFHRVVEWCLDILHARRTTEAALWYHPVLQFVLSRNLKDYLRHRLHAYRDLTRLGLSQLRLGRL